MPAPLPQSLLRCALLLACASCAGGESAPAPAAPPLEPWPERPQAPLAEQLYGGEVGAPAAALGDQVRILMWLRSLELSPEQLQGFCDAADRVAAARAQAQLRRAEAAATELAALSPVYTQLLDRLAQGPLTEAQGAEYAKQLQDLNSGKQQALWVETALIDATLAEAGGLLDQLSNRAGLPNALFLLRQQLGDGVRPALYEGLIGRPWDPGDFSTLRAARSPDGQGNLDLGALWTLEGGDRPLLQRVDRLKLQVVIGLALDHPQTVPACQRLQSPPKP